MVDAWRQGLHGGALRMRIDSLRTRAAALRMRRIAPRMRVGARRMPDGVMRVRAAAVRVRTMAARKRIRSAFASEKSTRRCSRRYPVPMRSMPRLLLSLAIALIAVPALAQSDPRQYAPDPQVDYTHLKLEIDMQPEDKAFDAVETLRFTTLGVPLERLELDGVGMTIDSVEGEHVDSFRHDGKRLLVRFKQPLEPRSEHEIVFTYRVENPADGMTFALPDEAYPDRPLMVHTQGQPEQNRNWVICHDYPNEFLTTEMVVTVPDGLKVLANGERLAPGKVGFIPPSGEAATQPDGGMNPTLQGNVWHYRMQKPHVTYLMSLVVGEFDVVRDDDWRGRRIEYWVPPGRAEDAERTFGRTKHMLDFFSDKLGEYPWEAYSQSVVYLFGSGGMENTTVTTMYQDCIVDERAAIGSTLDGLVAHELAHQWFGDHTTCRTWAHLWLNEGFATFLDHAWHEAYHGREEYAYEVFTNMRRNAQSDNAEAKYGLVWPEYEEPGNTFRRGVCNPYGKGSAVIHMLREFTGNDDAFWEALKLFQDRHALSDVETDELRQCFEEVTGKSYDRFFQQWVYRPGSPKLDVTYAWNEEAGTVDLTFRQTQPITENTPAFVHDYPVWCVMENGDVKEFTVKLDAARNNATLATGEEPAMVCLDPNNSMISIVDFKLPMAMTLRQAVDGPTPFSRLRAIERLGGIGNRDTTDALFYVLASDDLHWGLRAEAARSLGRIDSADAREMLQIALDNGGVDHPRARLAAVDALGLYKSEAAASALAEFAEDDESLYVEAAALSGLGNQEATDELVQLLLEKTKDNGHGLRVRSAAVRALADLGREEGLQPAMDFADYGTSFRARGNGFAALATLYPSLEAEQKKEVITFLEGLTDDPMPRFASAAIRTLGDTLDADALPHLRRVADSAAPDDLKETARAAIRQIESGDGEPTLLRQLRDRLEALEGDLEASRAERVEKAREGDATTRPASDE